MEVLPESLLDVLRGIRLTEEQAREIFSQGEEAGVFVLLELSKRLAEPQGKTAAESHQTPGTPSEMKPPYRKPPGKSRKKRPGAKPGHRGARRKVPERIDGQEEHRADRCPDCGGRLQRCRETRTRYSAVLHADESGWRVEGKTPWLWCFTTRKLTYYTIDAAGLRP